LHHTQHHPTSTLLPYTTLFRSGGKLSKLGEDVTETLEVVPRQWKVIQTVREKFSCRSCQRITQPPAPFHAIARGRAGASLLAMIDRKSTRLNSSHVAISYAVFC